MQTCVVIHLRFIVVYEFHILLVELPYYCYISSGAKQKFKQTFNHLLHRSEYCPLQIKMALLHEIKSFLNLVLSIDNKHFQVKNQPGNKCIQMLESYILPIKTLFDAFITILVSYTCTRLSNSYINSSFILRINLLFWKQTVLYIMQIRTLLRQPLSYNY